MSTVTVELQDQLVHSSKKVKNNIITFRKNEIFNEIIAFIKDQGNSSENTAKAYETDIRQFFKYLSEARNGEEKDIEHLTLDDLEIKNSDVRSYRTFMIDEKRYKNSTVNRKINTLKSLYDFLKGNGYNVNPDALTLKSLPSNYRGSDILYKDEVEIMAEFALEYEKHNPRMKKALIMTGFATSLRIGALLKLSLDDIRQCDDNPETYIIQPNYLDKGKPIKKEIHVDCYNLIVDAINEENPFRKDNRIFTIDANGVGDMLKRLCKLMNIDPKRKITFHSLRKGGAQFVNELTNGDVTAITGQGAWSSASIPVNHYLKKEINIAGMAAFEKFDNNLFEQLTRSQLLELIQSENNGVGIRLKRKAQALVNKETE